MSWVEVFSLCLSLKNGELIDSRMRDVELMRTDFFFLFSVSLVLAGLRFRHAQEVYRETRSCAISATTNRDMLPSPQSTRSAAAGVVYFPVTGSVSAHWGRSTTLAVASLVAAGLSCSWAQPGNYSDFSITDTRAHHTRFITSTPSRFFKPFAMGPIFSRHIPPLPGDPA